MDPVRRYELTNLVLFVAALGHALATWPLESTMALFVGGGAVAFVLEAAGIAAGLFRHEMDPKVLGVPLPVVVGWPAVVYLAYRLALLALPPGIQAAVGAAMVATALDAVTEPPALAEGVWEYPAHPLSSPRLAGVPWWNFVAWFVLTFTIALLPSVV